MYRANIASRSKNAKTFNCHLAHIVKDRTDAYTRQRIGLLGYMTGLLDSTITKIRLLSTVACHKWHAYLLIVIASLM